MLHFFWMLACSIAGRWGRTSAAESSRQAARTRGVHVANDSEEDGDVLAHSQRGVAIGNFLRLLSGFPPAK
jgi:hypothetical protein